jgi:homoserine dehydrogenase
MSKLALLAMIFSAPAGACATIGSSTLMLRGGAGDGPDVSRPVPFVLLGCGGVGAALLNAVLDSRDVHALTHGLRFELAGVTDSSGAVIGQMSDDAVRSLLAHKEGGGRLCDLAPASGAEVDRATNAPAEFIQSVVRRCGEKHDGRCIVVDCTASGDTLPALLEAAATDGMQVASANKKPFSSDLDVFDRLAGAPASASKTRFESAVGAGLPAIATMQRLRGAADGVVRIGGALSGTLGFVMSGLQDGEPFSSVVLKAKELGYTEPDPRDDLGGVDVARKALILARLAGLRLELDDVAIEPLFAADMAEIPVARFLERLPELDEAMAQRATAAADRGNVLRYVGSVRVDAAVPGGGKLVVGLEEVPLTSPLGSLRGSDNLLEFYTGWYPESPLVLRGAGAGVGTTAAGVLADMVELAFARA